MKHMLWWLAIIFTAYAIIPAVISRLFGLGVFRKGQARRHRQIAFTFDDGPDPHYTPMLLDVLKKYNVKATFFVLGWKAEKYPELILRMHLEGHLIGIHNYTHKSNWLMTPRAVRKQINFTADIVENITGVRPAYYRPPWGLLNLFDFALKKKMHIVLWTCMLGDWRTRIAKFSLKRKLLDNVKTNEIVVLHDSGQTFGANVDAPLYMITALKEFFNEKKSDDVDYVRVDEMIGTEA